MGLDLTSIDAPEEDRDGQVELRESPQHGADDGEQVLRVQTPFADEDSAHVAGPLAPRGGALHLRACR